MGGTSVDEGDADCQCSCAGSVNCPQYIQIDTFNVANCQGVPCNQASSGEYTDLCTPIGSGTCTQPQSYQIRSYSASNTCSPTVSSDFEEPKFSETLVGCGASAGPACENGGTCLPTPSAPFESSFCLAATGDLECPGAYPNKRLVFNGLNDDRSCGACQCMPYCVLHGADCNKAATTPIGPSGSSCLPFNSVPGSSTGRYTRTEGCAVSAPPAVVGEVSGTDPITVCCE